VAVDGKHGLLVTRARVAIVGAGPAGLMAAEQLSAMGHCVTIYDRMPSPARKFLMAGRGGLNLTHSEDASRLGQRYGQASESLSQALAAFPASALIAWADGLGAETFVGSSGRVFPRAMKASPLLRAWLRRLATNGVTLAAEHNWQGFDTSSALIFDVAGAPLMIKADAIVLALGGASWPRLGSNGAWVDILARDGVTIAPLVPSNSGALVSWSAHLSERFAGHPLKRIALSVGQQLSRGEALITKSGLEGGTVYALSTAIRNEVSAKGHADLVIDLRPDMTLSELTQRLSVPRNKQSAATFLRKVASLSPASIALLREAGPPAHDAATLASQIKAIRLVATGIAGLERAISTAGGVAFSAVDAHFMLKTHPGVFVAGEMLDWEAPTGGYLLQASFATAVAAATGADRWLADVKGTSTAKLTNAL
jgi:uncharacterized flavoprotein (TIGR03862 family)